MVKFYFGKEDARGDDCEVVEADTLEAALEMFCSTCDEPEKFVGREEREETAPMPMGYNQKGHKFDPKPTLHRDVPDDEVIQVWKWDEKALHWNWEDDHHGRRGYSERGALVLIYELPISEIWKHDRWGNVEHPKLPSPDSVSLPDSDIKSLDKYQGRKLRTLNRSEIVAIKRQLIVNKEAIEKRANALEEVADALEHELKLRKEQLELINLYLGRGVDFVKIRSGPSAPDSEKISVRQRVLYMDEEVGVLSDGKELDFTTIRQFDRWISRPEYLAVIAPEQKCVVAIKPKRRDVCYSDNPVENDFLNVPNRETYLLFRNGANVWRVLSSVHVGSKLFPEPEVIDLLVKKEYERHVEGHGGFKFSSGWSDKWWEEHRAEHQKKVRERERIKRQLGVTDADFREPIPEMEYTTKEAFLAAKKRWEAMLKNPEAHVSNESKKWILEHVFDDYKKDLKDFMAGLVLLQGVLDRTDIFGALVRGKINVFSGEGVKEYCNQIYDDSEAHLIEDKSVPSLEEWLYEEAKKVKKFDYVFSTETTTDHSSYAMRSQYDRGRTIVGMVVKVLGEGKVIVKTLRKSEGWGYYSKRPRVANALHKIENKDGRLNFFPLDLSLDKIDFYLNRRQDRHRYWNNILYQFLQIKRLKAEGKTPEVSEVKWQERISDW